MNSPPSPSTDKARKAANDDSRNSLLNVPNLLSAIRFVGSIVLVGLTWADLSQEYLLALIVFLLLTDWVDGKLAIMLEQQTKFGAKLDSVADATFYGSVLVVMLWLKTDLIRQESPWIIAALSAYAVNMLAAIIKFRRFAAYHTRAAKTGWLLVSIAIISVFADWSPWPLRIACTGILLTNLEQTAITFVLLRPHVDIPSLYHAIKIRREQAKNREPRC